MGDLFRPEVNARKADHLPGTISLTLPLRWQVIIFALATMLTVVGLFLTTASYARTEAATGQLVPDAGLAEIKPTRSGRIEAIGASEGAIVKAGDVLARIRVDESDAKGNSSQEDAIAAVLIQAREIGTQEARSREASSFEQAEFAARIRGAESELLHITSQIQVQRQLVDLAQVELDRVREVAKKGFLSERDFATREETYLTRVQRLQSLEGEKAAKLGQLVQTQRSRQQAASRSGADLAALRGTRAQIAREAVGAGLQKGYTLTAPTAGRVTSVNAFVGKVVSGNDTIMLVTPLRGKLTVRLELPERAIGSVRVGQAVRMAVDAYPYERFGHVRGQIIEISSTPVARRLEDGSFKSIYLVKARLDSEILQARGSHFSLRAGMHVTARIVTEERTVLAWLIQPLTSAMAQ